MRRSLIVLAGAMLLCGATFAAAYYVARGVAVSHEENQIDDLDWLRVEFKLKPAEMARIRKLHEGYLPQCAAMCRQIAAKKAEIRDTMAGTTNVTAATQQKLLELGQLRAQCQARMFSHFADVSQSMPPEEGRRYLAEMQRLVLGAHDQIEQSMQPMAGHDGHEHGNN